MLSTAAIVGIIVGIIVVVLAVMYFRRGGSGSGDSDPSLLDDDLRATIGDTLVDMMKACQVVVNATSKDKISMKTQADFVRLGKQCVGIDGVSVAKTAAKKVAEHYWKVLKPKVGNEYKRLLQDLEKDGGAEIRKLLKDSKAKDILTALGRLESELKTRAKAVADVIESIAHLPFGKDILADAKLLRDKGKEIVALLRSANIKTIEQKFEKNIKFIRFLMERHHHPKSRMQTDAGAIGTMRHDLKRWYNHMKPAITAAELRAFQGMREANDANSSPIQRARAFADFSARAMGGNAKNFNYTKAMDPLAANDATPDQMFPKPSPSQSNPLAKLYTFENYRHANAVDDFTYNLRPTYERQGQAKLGYRMDLSRWRQGLQYVRDSFKSIEDLICLYESPTKIGDTFTPWEMQYGAVEALGLKPRDMYDGVGARAAAALLNSAVPSKPAFPAPRQFVRVPRHD